MINLKFNAEYASEVMNTLPYGYIDKTVCGCGLTTIALENDVNTIIAVPSIELIRNKTVQYPNERCNKKILGVYGNIDENEITNYIKENKPYKIMVTYDSLHRLEYLLPKSHLVIDESNKLLKVSKLKSHSKMTCKSTDVTTKVFSIAEKYKDTTTFISATPIHIDFMPKWISNIEQVKIEWNNTIKAKPVLMERTYPFKALSSELLHPIKENGYVQLNNLKLTKLIIFINSVESIIKIIREVNLDKDDVAIIAADNIKNDLKIRGYNRLTNPRKLPKFTFITSSGFEGIDLEDKEAISVVVSNTAKSYHMIDLLTDLKQAISRQRDKQNPNYDKFVYIYNQSLFSKSKEDMEKELDEKLNSIKEAICLWEIAKQENKTNGFKYTEEHADFIAYTNYVEETNSYIVNENLFNADKYFILYIRDQYSKGFDIKANYDEFDIIQPSIIVKDITYEEMVNIYKETKNIEEYQYKIEYYNIIMNSIKYYGKTWLNYTYAKNMVNSYKNEYIQILHTIRNAFKLNYRYTVKDAKEILQTIYDQYKLNRKAKSTDLKEFVMVEEKLLNGVRYITILDKNKTLNHNN